MAKFKVVARGEVEFPYYAKRRAVAFEFPPQTHQLFIHGRLTTVPLPYLVIVTVQENQPSVFVRNEPVTSLDDMLYLPPLGNVYQSGQTCNIAVRRKTPAQIANIVLRSSFGNMYHYSLPLPMQELRSMTPAELCDLPWTEGSVNNYDRRTNRHKLRPTKVSTLCDELVADALVKP